MIYSALIGGSLTAMTVVSASAELSFSYPHDGTLRQQSAFCVTVRHANELAMDDAASKIDHLGTSRPAPVPDDVVELVGGAIEYERAQGSADNWVQQIESLSSTYYYPLMSGTGTPYTTAEGQVLLTAFTQCLDSMTRVARD